MTHINDDHYDAENPQIIRSVEEINKDVLRGRPQYLVVDEFTTVPDPTAWQDFDMRRAMLSFPKGAQAVYRENAKENGINVRYYPNPATGQPGYSIQLDHHDPVSDPVGHLMNDLSPEQKTAAAGLGLVAAVVLLGGRR